MANAAAPSHQRPDPPSQSRSASVAGWFRNLSPEAVLVGLGLFVLLAAFVAADPQAKVTYSSSPFTDEAFNVVNARNLVMFGRWSTDEWNLHLVNLPFSLVEAIWLRIVGVGIVQARLIAIAAICLTAAAIVGGLRGVVGRVAATFAGLAFAGSGLILFYGRLAYLEDLVVLGLVLGALVLVSDQRLTLRWGLFSGVCFAASIGTKPSAAFAVTGIVLAVAVLGRREPGARRWIAGVVATVAGAGLAWILVVWLPNRDAVAMDLKIWAPITFSLAPGDAIGTAWHYLAGGSDHLFYPTQLGPLAALGAAGFAVVVVLRRRLSRVQARLALVSIAWLAFGFGVLMIASYRPNRYVVPLVPPLAILAAIGLDLMSGWLKTTVGARPSADSEPSGPARRAGAGWAVPGLAIAVFAVALAPGLVWYGSWARSASYNLPDIQARLASAVPDGERVAGRQSALFMMDSGAITLITQPGGEPANGGDLYAEGVRWYVLPVDDPAPAGVSSGIWAARQKVACGDYGGATECLFHVS